MVSTYVKLVSDNTTKLLQSGKCNQTHANSIFHCTASRIHTHPSVWLTISNQSWGINQLDCTYFSVCLSWTKYLSTYLVLSHLNTWLFCVHCWIYSIIYTMITFYISTNDDASVYSKFMTNELKSWTRISLPIIYILIRSTQLDTYKLTVCFIQAEYVHHNNDRLASHKNSPLKPNCFDKLGCMCMPKLWKVILNCSSSTEADARAKVASATSTRSSGSYLSDTAPLKSRRCWFYWVSSS